MCLLSFGNEIARFARKLIQGRQVLSALLVMAHLWLEECISVEGLGKSII